MIIIAEYDSSGTSAVVRIKFIDIPACLSYITAAFLTSVGFSIFSITFQNVLSEGGFLLKYQFIERSSHKIAHNSTLIIVF